MIRICSLGQNVRTRLRHGQRRKSSLTFLELVLKGVLNGNSMSRPIEDVRVDRMGDWASRLRRLDMKVGKEIRRSID